MKQVLGGVLLFVLGVVIGTAGSDDSLLQEARQQQSFSYKRGRVDAATELQVIAVQLGHAKWAYDPHTGKPDQFVWRIPDREAEIANCRIHQEAPGGAIENLSECVR